MRYQESIAESTYDSGVIEGEIKGKIEGKIEVAKKMKVTGMAVKVIQEMTGLSVDEVNKIIP